MKTTRHLSRFALAPVFIGVVCLASQALAAPVYQCQLLNPPSGETSGGAPTAINRGGDVIGEFEYLPRKWDQQNNAQAIGHETFSVGFTMGAINDAGYAVGYASNIIGPHPEGYTGFIWSPDGTGQRLTQYPNQHTAGLGLNNAGVVVGWASTTSGPTKATTWKDGVQKFLPPLQAGKSAEAHQINDKDVIVGESDLTIDGVKRTHAVKWVSRKAKDLGVLPGHVFSSALALNTAGVIVGYSHDGVALQPVAWVNGVIQSLTPDQSAGAAYGVNKRGEIVGSTTALGATYWPQAGAQPVKLDSVILADHPCRSAEGTVIPLSTATAINASGVIVGYGVGTTPWGSNYPAGFRLVPVTAQ
jgi:probable HAF family extracellular repeat protein